MTGKKILITGSAGFFGRYMAEYLNRLGAGHKIFGIDNREDKFCEKFFNVDISEGNAVSGVIAEVMPDVVIHLAGTFGMDDNQQIYKTNVLSIVVLLEAVRKFDTKCAVVAAGSAAEYGRIDAERMPADESVPCMPVMPYGLSKWLATQTALYYHRVHNLNVSIVRPFQLIGRGVTNKLAPGAFFEQIVNARQSGNKIIKVGNLKSSRDFLDVRDAARAVWMLCEKPAAGEIFNLCSGTPTVTGDLLKLMIDTSGIEVKIEVDPNRLKGSADVSEVYGSYSKIIKHCGWAPEIGIEKTIRDMFNG
jgi:GDP-4-dehydro-6-deoxy-D-mannose reductase